MIKKGAFASLLANDAAQSPSSTLFTIYLRSEGTCSSNNTCRQIGITGKSLVRTITIIYLLFIIVVVELELWERHKAISSLSLSFSPVPVGERSKINSVQRGRASVCTGSLWPIGLNAKLLPKSFVSISIPLVCACVPVPVTVPPTSTKRRSQAATGFNEHLQRTQPSSFNFSTDA